MTTDLTVKSQAEVIESMIRNRTANFTPELIAAWVSEQGIATTPEDVLPVIGVLSMRGVVRRESMTTWAPIGRMPIGLPIGAL